MPLCDHPATRRCTNISGGNLWAGHCAPSGSALGAVGSAAPALTWGRLITAWTPNVGALAVVAVLALAYGLGMRRLHRQGEVWPRGRLWWFLTGLMSILLVTVSAIGAYAGTLFWARAVHNIVLLMITPMFLAAGAPLTLLRDTLAEPARQQASRILHSQPARLLTFPLVITAVLIAPLYLLYLTPLYEPACGHRPWARWSVRVS